MIYWAPFLHFYQPPTQYHSILRKICDECYRPLVKMLLKHPSARVTININGILTELLHEHGGEDIILGMKELAAQGTLEFVDSAKYHAILPLIPEKEARRQIELNRKLNAHHFGEVYKPKGFFPPEMCYSEEVGELLADMGYEWVILSGVACSEHWPVDAVYKISTSQGDIVGLYRDDIISNKISFKNLDASGFVSEMKNLMRGKKDAYIITAMDAETFGHHIRHWEDQFLGRAFEMIDDQETKSIQVVKMSDLLKKIEIKPGKPPFSSSWSTSREDIMRKNYYPLWKNPGNSLHDLQWEHMKICFELVDEAYDLKDNEGSKLFSNISRKYLDEAVYSCQFWWANKGYGMFDVNLVNKGLLVQEEVILNAYKSIKLSGAREKLKREFYNEVVVSRDIAAKIRDQLFVM